MTRGRNLIRELCKEKKNTFIFIKIQILKLNCRFNGNSLIIQSKVQKECLSLLKK